MMASYSFLAGSGLPLDAGKAVSSCVQPPRGKRGAVSVRLILRGNMLCDTLKGWGLQETPCVEQGTGRGGARCLGCREPVTWRAAQVAALTCQPNAW